RRVKELVDTVQNRVWERLAGRAELEKVMEEKKAQLKALEEERDAVLEALLGASGHARRAADEQADVERVEARKQFLDFLSADKIEQGLALDDKLNRLRAEVCASQPPLPQTELEAALKTLQEQQEREFQSLLS